MGFVEEINRRKTFGIVSHPDAGKTTLTEKLLLFGGAIQTAGAVKSIRSRRQLLRILWKLKNREVSLLRLPLWDLSTGI